eukprot:CAMPEP_0185570982 /NCGR_PEP_ID=MMETSP0434-20130131/3081_1 /TAXON_ID=626734 ORGANISM="Favella taraikaensis, Strain Fe Narragansett Bay" /NCGR_SAMPLE_ID=MMETSP0434 /ASSEMBLY_ACC=CAM_ASM_000379 /LENGTH=205 /DNA_ID=CAMNT_0028186213 /DNA_START=12 /DNA_END=629 /DNA_ORIENTATION=+
MLRSSSAIACLAVGASATIHYGKCPRYLRLYEFDIHRFMGTWYEISKDKFNIDEIGASCTTVNFTLQPNGYITVYNRALEPVRGYIKSAGKGIESQVTALGSLVIDYEGMPAVDQPGNFNILETDYENYALVYNCQAKSRFGFSMRNESFSILARSQSLSDDLLAQLAEQTKSYLPNYDYDSNVRRIIQGGECEYAPNPPAEFLQ